MLNTDNYKRTNSKDIGKFRRVLLELVADQMFDSKETLQAAFDFTEGHCFYCGAKLYTRGTDGRDELIKTASLDHIIPALHLGVIAPGNAALSCVACNLNKGAHSVRDYYQRRFNAKMVCYFDTQSELDLALEELEATYSKSLPLLQLISRELESEEHENFSLGTFLNCISVNENGLKDLLVPFVTPPSKKDNNVTKSTTAANPGADETLADYYRRLLTPFGEDAIVINEKLEAELNQLDPALTNCRNVKRMVAKDVATILHSFNIESSQEFNDFQSLFTQLAVVTGNLKISQSKELRIKFSLILRNKHK